MKPLVLFQTLVIAGCFNAAMAMAADDYVPQPGQFPPADAGAVYSGELISVDHVNRRGALRLAGDGVDDRYHWAPPFKFALLPYGAVYFHGAPAELKDIPLGTVLHGRFVLPPAGDTTIPVPAEGAHYVPKQNHAVLLEDNVSFSLRNGIQWQIDFVDPKQGTLKVKPLGKPLKESVAREQVLEFDNSTRVWKGRQSATLTDLTPGHLVQFNLTWAPEWKNGQMHLADIWLDDESLQVARERQRQIHLRYEKVHGLPGWIDHVEHQPAGKGILTVTVFAGRDTALTDEIKQGQGLRIAAAENTLRTWWGDHDYKYGPVIELKRIEQPPAGSSGIQIRMQCDELLEGFRPTRIVRLFPHNWPRIKLPPEERVKTLDDR